MDVLVPIQTLENILGCKGNLNRGTIIPINVNKHIPICRFHHIEYYHYYSVDNVIESIKLLYNPHIYTTLLNSSEFIILVSFDNLLIITKSLIAENNYKPTLILKKEGMTNYIFYCENDNESFYFIFFREFILLLKIQNNNLYLSYRRIMKPIHHLKRKNKIVLGKQLPILKSNILLNPVYVRYLHENFVFLMLIYTKFLIL